MYISNIYITVIVCIAFTASLWSSEYTGNDLHLAAWYRNFKRVEELTNATTVNALDMDGTTPLGRALTSVSVYNSTKRMAVEIVAHLLMNGATMHARAKQKNALALALEHFNADERYDGDIINWLLARSVLAVIENPAQELFAAQSLAQGELAKAERYYRENPSILFSGDIECRFSRAHHMFHAIRLSYCGLKRIESGKASVASCTVCETVPIGFPVGKISR